MSKKNINFNDKKLNKSNFCIKKILFKIDDVDVNRILVSKKSLMLEKAHLHTLLGMMLMMTLDHYV